MKRLNLVTKIFCGLGLLLTCGMGHTANQYPPMQQPYGYQPGMPWQFRPAPQQPPRQLAPPANGGNGQGATPYNYSYSYGYSAPRTPMSPQGAPAARAYPRAPAQSAAAPPRVEVHIDNNEPYAQESVIYRVEIISSENLQTVDLTLPRSDAVVFNKLDGPLASVRTRNGHSEIVNLFRYAVIPLRAGSIELEPVSVTGSFTSSGRAGYGESAKFEATSNRSLFLQVKPAVDGVQPWLPLQHLGLRTESQGAERLEAGKPFTLVLELSAVGASGAQLPSLESQLKSPDFRVYREKTTTSGELSKDGRYLQGTRTEHYTLVPQFGGTLRMPELRVAWWNVNTDSLQHASIGTQPVSSGGDRRGDGRFGITQDSGFFPAGSSSVFWVPLAAVFGLLAGYWLAVWLRGTASATSEEQSISRWGLAWLRLKLALAPLSRRLGPALQRLTRPLASAANRVVPGFSEASAQAAASLRRLSPIRHGRRLGRTLVYTLPRPLRIWFSVQHLESEKNPLSWSRKLQSAAIEHLNLPPQAPLRSIGERIIALDPQVDAQRIRDLIHQLDAAVYGETSVDFDDWKREFSRAIRPKAALLRPRKKTGSSGLPELNPKIA